MTHFATGARGGFAVKMKVDIGQGKGGGPIGFANCPEVAQQVDHCSGAAWSRVAEREAADSAELLFKLADRAGFYRPMPGVVRARGKFIDNKACIAVVVKRDEKFDAQNADEAERVHNAPRDFLRFAGKGGRNVGFRRGSGSNIQNVVRVVVANNGVCRKRAIHTARRNNGRLTGKRNVPLQNAGEAVRAQLILRRKRRFGGANNALPLAVIAEPRGLQNGGQADLRYGGVQLRPIRHSGEWRHRETVVSQKSSSRASGSG